MSTTTVRPDVGTLVFRLFGRSVHPELFDTVAQLSIERKEYSATLRICDAGHAISFIHEGRILSEVATSGDYPLPQKRQIISRRLRGHRDESVKHDGGILYHTSFQVELLEPEVFLHFQQELLLDCGRCRLSHLFANNSRLQPVPLSYIQTEERVDSLLVHAFHTFPDNHAVVKTQSLFEV